MTTTAPSPLFRFTNTAEEEIPANQLHRYPANRIPTAAAIAAMRDSIAENGQLQPVTVRPIEDGAGGQRLEIIFGETRVLGAAALRPDHPVRAYIIPMTDQEAARIHAVENFTRQQLDPIEEAEAMENMRANGWEIQAIAETLNITRKTVSHRLRLLKLDEATRAALREGTITLHTAETIALLPPELQAKARTLCINPTYSAAPLPEREALREIEAKILAPMKRAEAWEARRPELEKAHPGAIMLPYEEAIQAPRWDSPYEDTEDTPNHGDLSHAARTGEIETPTWGQLAAKHGGLLHLALPSFNPQPDSPPILCVLYQPLIDAELAACEDCPEKCVFEHPKQKNANNLEKEKNAMLEEQRIAEEKAQTEALRAEIAEALLIISRPEAIQPAAAEKLCIEVFRCNAGDFPFRGGNIPGFDSEEDEQIEKVGIAYLRTKEIRGFEALGRLYCLAALDLHPNTWNSKLLARTLIGTKAVKEKQFPLLAEQWKEICAAQLAADEAALESGD
jgi:ParB family chromosome partitioning protein